jgi:2-hydroxychromene-2-carboxylate isomerase
MSISPQLDTATLYFDLASPYAYLAFERAESVLGLAPELEPILVGAIFHWRDRGSWALTDERAANVAEIERRARTYGLPPLAWPRTWPANSLTAMRAATWAKRQGHGRSFAHCLFTRQFGAAADITDPGVLAACASAVGLDAHALLAATGEQAIKDELKRVTEQAWADGVRGVPSVRVGQEVVFGDDQLERAAGLLHGG